jgi:hypothetical protein
MRAYSIGRHDYLIIMAADSIGPRDFFIGSRDYSIGTRDYYVGGGADRPRRPAGQVGLLS